MVLAKDLKAKNATSSSSSSSRSNIRRDIRMGALPHPVLALAGCPSVADLVLGAFEVLHESAGFEKGLMGLKGMAHSSLQALSLFTELGLCGYAFRLREAFQASLRDSEKSCDHHARAPSNAVHCDVCDCKCFLCA